MSDLLTGKALAIDLYLQTFNDTAILNVLRNDFVDVGFIDIGVPDLFRVHDQHRTFRAAVETASKIDAHFALAVQIELLDAILGVSAYSFGIVLIAAFFAVVALINAEKYVVLVKAHVVDYS